MQRLLLLTIFVSMLSACATRSAQTDRSKQQPKLIRDCPSEWIINRQPRVVTPGQEEKGEEYFIMRGRRYEKTAFDLAWIQQNCNLQPTVVH
jgi:hypothetical protein